MAKEAKSQGFTGTQKGLSYVGNNAYAYSGNILINSAATVALLEFTTGSEYIEATITGGRNMKSNAETTSQILFNDEIVFSSKYDNGASLTLKCRTERYDLRVQV